VTIRALADLAGQNGLFVDGDWVESKDQDPNGDTRLVQLADVGDGEWLDKSARFMTAEKAVTLRCTPLKEGDLLIARMPDPLGRACIFPGSDQQCVTVVDVAILRADPRLAFTPWLKHAVNSTAFRSKMERQTTGTTRQRISRGNLGQLTLDVPPLPEQKRIAAILDKADAIRKKRQEAIRLTEELLRSAFLEMFGDYLRPNRCRPLKDVCSVLLDCRNKTAPYEVSGIPLIRTTNFRNNSLDLSSLKYVSDATNKVWSSRHQTSPGDVVYCREAPFGMAAIVPESFFPCLGQRIMVARPDQKMVTTKFLWTALNSPFVFSQAERVAVGATVKHLRVGDVEKLEIPVPPLTLQTRFSRMSDAIASLVTSFGTSMRLTEVCSSSLTQRAFSGKL
jgi:type I restriction enzyme, S subunit